MKDVQCGKHEKTVQCAIAASTDRHRRSEGKNRRTILDTLTGNNISNRRTDCIEYFTSLPNYKFVISPEGNGIDCHRHYEALVAGCIPVVERHEGICKKYQGCPILWTDDYSEITENYLLKKYEEMIDQTYDFSALYINTYPDADQNQIRYNGNYWCSKMTKGSIWYE
jgi:hypothetical protein